MRPDLRQLARIRATLDAGAPIEVAPAETGLLYANARRATLTAIGSSSLVDEFEFLFPELDPRFALSPQYQVLLRYQLSAWLESFEQPPEDEAVRSPELVLVDSAAAVAGDTATWHDPWAPPRRRRPLALAATAHAVRTSAKTIVINLALLIAVAAVVLVLSVRH